MAAGFLGRFYRLGRNLIAYGLGGSGAPPVVLVPIPGCGTITFEPTAIATLTFEPTADPTVSFEPTAIVAITFEGC